MIINRLELFLILEKDLFRIVISSPSSSSDAGRPHFNELMSLDVPFLVSDRTGLPPETET